MDLLEPAIEGLGYELVELEHRAGNRGLVRLYIDHPDGIGLDDCEQVSHEVSALLDVSDPLPGKYVLEVSSPGEDRVLRKPQHFAAFTGERIRVELTTEHEGRRRYTGSLVGIEDEEVLVESDGELVRLQLGAIARARLAPLHNTGK